MARTHIHKYQTRYHAQTTYSRAIRARGDFVFMRGQVGALPDGALNGEGDPGAQADQACRNIDRWMEEAGGSLADVCKLTVYVTDISYRPLRFMRRSTAGSTVCITVRPMWSCKGLRTRVCRSKSMQWA